MTIDPKELETLKLMNSDERFMFFMESVLETDTIWGLCGENWASFFDDAQGIQAFPIWSEKEFAESNAIDEWSGFEAKAFTPQQLIEELAPGLAQNNFQFSVFKLPGDSGCLIKTELVANRLKKKLS